VGGELDKIRFLRGHLDPAYASICARRESLRHAEVQNTVFAVL
jgi:hypothetical protein